MGPKIVRFAPILSVRLTVLSAAAFLAVVLGSGGVSAQAELETTAVDSLTADMDSTAMVVLAGQDLFELGSQSVESADKRAAALSGAILEVAKSRRISTEDLRLIRDERIQATLIMGGRLFLDAVWDYEAADLGVTAEDLAAQRLDIIRQAITDYRSDFSTRSLIQGAIFGGLAVIALLIFLKLMAVVRGRFEKMLERRLAGRTLFKVLEGESVVGAVTAIDRLVYVFVAIWLILAVLNFLLSLFPWTAGVASDVYDLAAGPLRAFGKALVEEAPSLFFLVFIGFVTVVILRGIRFFFHEIERERIKFSGFYSDWARPTFNIIRLVVLAFAIVVAIPYIPGSSSGAFKGMSLFLGILVSLGSGSAVTNIVSGVILIYMRPFALGDRVQIGEAVGDVVDRNLLTTRIRTPKNERVTIPNSNILSGQIINFTSKARKKELILHTSVTIGYDVPWRQVHELLMEAAKGTENVMDDPEPFVLQKGLQDFYVEYELNGYTDRPRLIPRTYSDLHQNIQDAFDSEGVQILSPHYRMLRKEDPQAGSE